MKILSSKYPHEREGRPKPVYGEARADGFRFKGWIKNASGDRREQWLNPETWERLDAKRKQSQDTCKTLDTVTAMARRLRNEDEEGFTPRVKRGTGMRPHVRDGRPKPNYGETRADGRRFRGWIKNVSGDYREQWLTPESWAKNNERKNSARVSYQKRNQKVRNEERKARNNGTLAEKKATGELVRLAISEHGITAEEFDAMTPEAQDLLRALDKLGK